MAGATILTITDAVCLFALGDTEPADWTDVAVEAFTCQVTTAQINATPNLNEVPATWCQPATQVPAATSYALDLAGLQDWTVAAGLSMFLLANDAKPGWVQLSMPTQDPGDPIATATVQVRYVAGSFGGAAGAPLTFEASFPVQGKPDVVAGTVPAGP
jgi:hypothetical protein